MAADYAARIGRTRPVAPLSPANNTGNLAGEALDSSERRALPKRAESAPLVLAKGL